MKREEAIKFWKFRYENAKDYTDPHWEAQERREHREYVEALRMAIETLQGDMYCPNCGVRLVPENEYLEPIQTHGRLIDADLLMKELSDIQPYNWTDSEAEIQEEADYSLFKSLINSAPTVQADRPHGVWEYTEITTDNDTYSEWVCSECGGSGYELMCFCPWCGADMRKEKK